MVSGKVVEHFTVEGITDWQTVWLISAGIYGYPKTEAQDVAEDEIQIWLADTGMDLDVWLVLWP